MKLRCLSDLHLEFVKESKIDEFIRRIPKGDNDEVCILAGDIGNPYSPTYDVLMQYISTAFTKTFVIAGNHEYYNNRSIIETDRHLVRYFEKFHNITFLNNACEYYENYWFIGTTLWCKITHPEFEINDINNIPDFDHFVCNELNEANVVFLQEAIAERENCIVITHHLPSESLIDPNYKTKQMEPYNQWFFSNLDDLIETNKNNIKCWLYGHTHSPKYSKLFGIPFLCNPIGYPNENKRVNWCKNVFLHPDY